MELPSVDSVNEQRLTRFKHKITEALADPSSLAPFRELVKAYEQEHGISALDIAAALGRLAQGETPLLQTADKHKTHAGDVRDKARPGTNPFASESRSRPPVRNERSERPTRATYAERPRPANFERPAARSEERRVGKAWDSKCRSRWSPYP